MMVERWGVRVPARLGEETRQALIREGALDTLLKVLREGDTIILPLTGPRDGAEQFEFEAHPGRTPLPRHELVGGIAILQEKDSAGAEKILASRPSLHTVVYAKGEVSGEIPHAGFCHPRRHSHDAHAGNRARVPLYGRPCRCLLLRPVFPPSASVSLIRYRKARLSSTCSPVSGRLRSRSQRKAALVVAADLNPQAVELMLAKPRAEPGEKRAAGSCGCPPPFRRSCHGSSTGS